MTTPSCLVRVVSRRLGTAVLLLVAALAWADQPLSQREADSFARKILGIQHYAAAGLRGARLTPVSEAELNSYIRFVLGPEIPAGIVEPYVSMLGEGLVAARAVVDLDAVRASRERGWLDPLAYVSGRLPVEAAGRLVAEGGVARFELTSASVAGVAIPKAVLQEVVSYYSKSTTAPGGIQLDAPFELPARIVEIGVEPGRAIVIQR